LLTAIGQGTQLSSCPVTRFLLSLATGFVVAEIRLSFVLRPSCFSFVFLRRQNAKQTFAKTRAQLVLSFRRGQFTQPWRRPLMWAWLCLKCASLPAHKSLYLI